MRALPLGALAAALLLASCDRLAMTPEAIPDAPRPEALRVLTCDASIAAGTVRCADATPGGGRFALYGGQGTHVQLRSSDVAYNSGTGIFSFNTTLENLLPQAIGTTDGTTLAASGIRVFFHSGPTVTGGTGSASVNNPSGTGTFTASGQPYFQWDEVLQPGDTSAAKPWELNIPATATTFTFSVAVSAPVAPLLVINEVMPNPGAVVDGSGEWFEIYNRGLDSVNLNGWRIASANDAGHVISGNVIVPARGVVVLGNNGNSATNGGVPVAYQYASVTLNNSNTDWLALRTPSGASHDSVHWGLGTNVPAEASRELSSPELDNTILMGPNWFTSTTGYGAGNDKGTPGSAGGGDPEPTGPAATVTISPTSASNATGSTRQFSAIARDSNNNVVTTTFTWASTDTAVATVNASGLATAKAAGTTSIIVTAATGVADTAALTVFVQPTSSVYRNHVEFGIPGDGTPGNEILLSKPEFYVSYSPVRGGPNWVSWNLNATHFGGAERCDCFSPDAQLPDSVYKVVTGDYTGSGYSRGHMVMSEQRTQTDPENAQTFLMTNILPQIQDMNGGPWLQFEIYANDLARISNKELYNIAGGLYSGSPSTLNGAGKVQIPTHTWKILVVMDSGKGLADVTSASDLTVYAVSMPNQSGIQSNPWTMYKVTVDALEAATGYDFLAGLPDAIEAAVESSIAP